MGMVSAYFPRAELPEPTIMAWAGELLDLEYEDTVQAVRELARTSHFPPALAEIVGKAAEFAEVRRDSERAEALQALPAFDVSDLPRNPSPPREESLSRIKRALRRVGREIPEA